MKPPILIVVLAVIFSFSGKLYAHEGMIHDEDKETMDPEKEVMMNNSKNTENEMPVETVKEIKALPNVGNKICPVSGDEIPAPGEKGTMGDEPVQYEYNGKIYNLCCTMCVKDFKKNPEKYSKIAEEEVTKAKMTPEENKEGQEDQTNPDHK